MMEQNKEIVSSVLQETELQVLLAGNGYESICGLFSNCVLSREDTIQTIVRLIQKGQLTVQENGLQCAEELKELLHRMGTSEHIVLIETPERSYCCYGGEQVILCEAVQYSPQTLRLTPMQYGTFEELLDELLPDNGMEAVPLMEELLWEGAEQQLLQVTAFDRGVQYITLQVTESVTLVRELNIQWPDGGENRMLYSREAVRLQILELLTGDRI